MSPNQFYQALVAHFDEQELQTLCFVLQVDYHSLPATGKANKARELLLLLARAERIDDLLKALAELRPKVAWPDVETLTQAIQPALITAAFKSTVVSPPPSQPIISIGGPMQGMVSGGDMTINAPVAGGDMTIHPEMPRWQRWGLLALLPLLVVVVGGLVMLVRPLMTPSAQAPDVDRLLPVAATLLPRLEVTAMTLAVTAGEEVLWFGAGHDGQSALYRLDVEARETAVPQAVLDVDAEIHQIMVDCRQNIWLVLNEIGVLVYQPVSERQDTLLSKATWPEQMKYNTIAALAHRCIGTEEVEVWLGRAGIQTIRYQFDYPTPETLRFVPSDTDPIFAASKDMEITDLLFVPEKSVLWASGQSGELLSVSTHQVRQPEMTKYTESALWALSLDPAGKIWVGGSHHLIEEGHLLALSSGDGKMPDSRARRLAAGSRWIWFGDRCLEMVVDCWVLGAYQNGRFFPVDLGTRREVTGLEIDSNGTVWIGTDYGLILYP